jgi:hypothetical protein
MQPGPPIILDHQSAKPALTIDAPAPAAGALLPVVPKARFQRDGRRCPLVSKTRLRHDGADEGAFTMVRSRSATTLMSSPPWGEATVEFTRFRNLLSRGGASSGMAPRGIEQ